MSYKLTSTKFELIDREISSGRAILSIKELCLLAGVSHSGYYRWKKAEPIRERKESQDLNDFMYIKQAFQFRGYDKGYRGIQMRLHRMDIWMNHKKVRRLMRKYGLYCPIRKPNPQRRMMKALQTDAISENIVDRNFKQGRRKILLTDITYIRLNDRFIYLSVIKDAFTTQILAYQLSESLEVGFVLDTVKMLIRDHGNTLDDKTMIHSDQGSHYTSIAFRDLIKDEGLIQSMSRKGNCWDNAPQESFFSILKEELKPYMKNWKTFQEVKERIDDWIDYYNKDRLQSSLKEMSPNEYDHYLLTNEYPTALAR